MIGDCRPGPLSTISGIGRNLPLKGASIRYIVEDRGEAGGQFVATLAVEIRILRCADWAKAQEANYLMERYNVFHNRSSFSKRHSNLDTCEWLALVKKATHVH